MPTIESGMVVPPATDEDTQVGPALYHEQSQGGPTKSDSSRVRSVWIMIARSRRLQNFQWDTSQHSDVSC